MNELVSAPEPLAVQAGQDVLINGGNAFDAAVAAAFVQGVTNPMQCGIGGSGLFLMHHAPTQETMLLDCSCSMGSLSFDAMGDHQHGYQSIMTPGVVKGAWEAFQRFGSGKVSWAELIEPAQVLASNGFAVDKYLASQWPQKAGPLSAEAAALYSRPRRLGEKLVQEDYGRSLRRIANFGADDFYSGTLSEDISLDMEENDGLIAWNDLRQYTTADVAPISGSYRGYEVYAGVSGFCHSPQVLAMLQILEGFDLSSMDTTSPEYINLLAQVIQAGFIDYLPLQGDPPFTVALHMLAKLASPQRAQYWQEQINSGMFKENIAQSPATGGRDNNVGATHICVVDNNGSAVSWTHGLGAWCGCGVITPGLGFLYNNYAARFNWTPGHWDSAAMGKRGGEGTPLLLFKNGKLYMAIGGVGGEQAITAILQVIINVVDHKMTMAEAIAAPRMHIGTEGAIYLEPGISEETAQALQAQGYCVSNTNRIGNVQGIVIPKSGE